MYTAKNSQVQKIWKQMGIKELFVVMGRGGRGREGEGGGGRGREGEGGGGREGMEIIPSLLFLVWEEKEK